MNENAYFPEKVLICILLMDMHYVMHGYESKQHFSFCKHEKVALAKLLKLFALWFF